VKTIIAIVLCGSIFFIHQKNNLVEIETPQDWPEPIYNFEENPLSKEQVLLGRVLFYDPILSINNTISCASCHSPYNAFTHVDHALSHGVYDSIGTRNSPALMNLAWQNTFMWDGAIHQLEAQSLAPISHPDEMASSINLVVDKLKESDIYPELFYAAFQDSTITGEKTLKAIAQFMLTLISANSKYDKVKIGEESFTEQESRGYELFQTYCNSCHQEPLFSNYSFKSNGITPDSILNDKGRFLISQDTADMYLFKVPSLRNIEYSYPYMHDGRFNHLSEVINHYVNVDTNLFFLSKELRNGIDLSSNEKVDLTAFLLCLSDVQFIFNKDIAFPKEIILNR